MSHTNEGTRFKAAGTAVLLLLSGALLGVLVDRLWLVPREAAAASLTMEAMAERLDLEPSEEARVRALLDSMHAEVMAAAQAGPDSLLVMARSAHQRLEAALPPDARPAFRAWMAAHHEAMMQRMEGRRRHESGAPEGSSPRDHR